MKHAFVLLLALTACASTDAPAAELDREYAIDAALTAWERQYLPLGDCVAARDSLGWVVADVAAFAALCRGTSETACSIVEQAGPVTIVLRDVQREPADAARTYAHELTHWLQHCSGRVPAGDSAHADREVWPVVVDATLQAMERRS